MLLVETISDLDTEYWQTEYFEGGSTHRTAVGCFHVAVLVIHYALFDGDKRRICHFTFIHTVHVIRYDIKAQEDTKGVFFLKFNSSSQQTKYLNTRNYRYCQGIRKEIATSQIAREL